MAEFESFSKWRTKIIIMLVIIFFMLLGFVAQCRAATWGDVVNDYLAYTANNPTSVIWIENQSGGMEVFRLWKRDNATTAIANTLYWETWEHESGSTCTRMVQECRVFCDGLENCVESVDVTSADCPSDIGMFTDWNLITSDDGVECRTLDTALHTYILTVTACLYNSSIYDHGYVVLNIPMTLSCTGCIPIGTVYGYKNSNYHATWNESGGYADFTTSETEQVCVYNPILGEPSSASVTAGAQQIPTQGAGSDLSLSSGESYTVNQGGAGSSGGGSSSGGSGGGLYGYDKASHLVDNGNGTQSVVSTVTSSGVTVTQTETFTMPTVSETSGYTNSEIEGAAVGNFGALGTQFANDLKSSALIAHFNLSSMVAGLSGGTPVIEMQTDRFGTQKFDLSASYFAAGLNIVRGVLLLLGGFLAIRIVILKR
jgi:uncharacterized membrane protein YgcG